MSLPVWLPDPIRGVSVPGSMFLSVQGVCVHGGGFLSMGVSVWGVSVQGDLCPGGLCRETHSLDRDPPIVYEWVVRIVLECWFVFEFLIT